MVVQAGARLVASQRTQHVTWNAPGMWEPAPPGRSEGVPEGNSIYKTQVTSGFSDRCGQILEGSMESSQRRAQRGQVMEATGTGGPGSVEGEEAQP